MLNLSTNLKQLKSRLNRPDFNHYPRDIEEAILAIGIDEQTPSLFEEDEEEYDIMSTGPHPKIWKQRSASVNQKSHQMRKC